MNERRAKKPTIREHDLLFEGWACVLNLEISGNFLAKSNSIATTFSFWGPLGYVSDKGYLVLYRVIRLLLHLSRDTGPTEWFESWLGHLYIMGLRSFHY